MGRVPEAAAGLRKMREAGVERQEMLLLPPGRRPTLLLGEFFSLASHRSPEVGLVFLQVQVSVSSSVTWEGKVDHVIRVLTV